MDTRDYFASLSDEARRLLKRVEQPQWMAPMLATLTDRRFSDPAWIYERKFDGERILAFRGRSEVRLYTRNRKEATRFFPELAEALETERCGRFIVDGEVVAFDGNKTSFAQLQTRMHRLDPDARRRVPVYYYVFDVLYLDDYATTSLPLRARKELLRRSLSFDDPIRFTVHRERDGEAYYESACKRGWEGVIAKRADSPYQHRRSGDGLKFKCSMSLELVIGGFTAPQGSRQGFGALLVGYYEDSKLRFAGRVGTGFTAETLKDLHARMLRLAQGESPFADPTRERNVTWIAPKLVGEFSFSEWTPGGRLRHPSYVGLRNDKQAREVAREKPAA